MSPSNSSFHPMESTGSTNPLSNLPTRRLDTHSMTSKKSESKRFHFFTNKNDCFLDLNSMNFRTIFYSNSNCCPSWRAPDSICSLENWSSAAMFPWWRRAPHSARINFVQTTNPSRCKMDSLGSAVFVAPNFIRITSKNRPDKKQKECKYLLLFPFL